MGWGEAPGEGGAGGEAGKGMNGYDDTTEREMMIPK